jgi:sugar lactone lactonase YvrE
VIGDWKSRSLVLAVAFAGCVTALPEGLLLCAVDAGPNGDGGTCGDGWSCFEGKCYEEGAIPDGGETESATTGSSGGASSVGTSTSGSSGMSTTGPTSSTSASGTTTAATTTSVGVTNGSAVGTTSGGTTGGSTVGSTSGGTTSGGTTSGSTVGSTSGGTTSGAVDAGPIVSTFTANGDFDIPGGIAIDADGNLYVTDLHADLIRKVDPSGGVSTVAGNGNPGCVNGSASQAEFNEPWGVAVDAYGNLYVADSKNNRIRLVDDGGNVSTLAGNGDAGFSDGDAGTAAFDRPVMVALDDVGNVFVADANNRRIREIEVGGLVITFAGNGINGGINGLAADAEFTNPFGLAIDSLGNMYVSDGTEREISNGNVSPFSGGNSPGFINGNAAMSALNNPKGLAIDPTGNLIVADTGNNAIRRIDPAGNVTTIAGNGDAGFVNGPGLLAQFNFPTDVAVDRQGNIYVADYNNGCIRLIQP